MSDVAIFNIDEDAYEVSTSLSLQYVSNEIHLCFEIVPNDLDEPNDWNLSVQFNTHFSVIAELKNKEFVWHGNKNQDGDCAGFFNLMEENVDEGTIKIEDIENHKMTVAWYGTFGSSAFHTIFIVDIPKRKEFVIDVKKTTEIRIDHSTKLEIINLAEFNQELLAYSKSLNRKNLKFSIMKPKKGFFHAVLKLKLTLDKQIYFGEVAFEGDTRNYIFNMDPACPRKICFNYISWDLKLATEKFSFYVD